MTKSTQTLLKGTVIENSLQSKGVLNEIKIERTWQAGNWTLHDIWLKKDQAEQFGKYLSAGPWYVHFWEPGSDEILVVFKDKPFVIRRSDKSTWSEAIEYGKAMEIPEEQLTFVIT